MELQPLLENELVKLRPLSLEDLEPLYAVAKDPKIWEQHPCKRNLRSEFETFFEDSIESHGAFVILDQKNGRIIGSSRFEKVEALPGAIEIGWTFLDREYWGGTYNKAVKELMLKHAFQFFDQVIFYVAKENIRSQKAVEKIGGKQISEKEREKLAKKSSEHMIYSIKKPS